MINNVNQEERALVRTGQYKTLSSFLQQPYPNWYKRTATQLFMDIVEKEVS